MNVLKSVHRAIAARIPGTEASIAAAKRKLDYEFHAGTKVSIAAAKQKMDREFRAAGYSHKEAKTATSKYFNRDRG